MSEAAMVPARYAHRGSGHQGQASAMVFPWNSRHVLSNESSPLSISLQTSGNRLGRLETNSVRIAAPVAVRNHRGSKQKHCPLTLGSSRY